MILYLGTSSLIQLYVTEAGTESVKGWAGAAEMVATARIAYTETMSAFDIRFKKGDITATDLEKVTERFSLDWERIVKVDFDDREAGRFIRTYGLTRFGAIHLSAAKLILAAQETHNLRVALFFSSADQRLCKAAAAEGLRVLRPNHCTGTKGGAQWPIFATPA
jgi:predicted nucleic acid-binding protein